MARSVRSECAKVKQLCTGRVESRRRPRSRPSADSYTIYLDECGQHVVGAEDKFPVFVLAGAIIRDADYPVVDAVWKRWKHENLGSEEIIVHEPDLRRRTGPFRGEAGIAATTALGGALAGLDFDAVVVVVHRGDYLADYGVGPIDSSLPEHAYLMALDFLMERCLFALDGQLGGGRAVVIAESRGPKEDAMLQHEFARLHLDGTSYISHTWFRQQLHPGIRFLSKLDNNTGLQIADLLARPVGMKVADPTSDPVWWDVFRPKLCKGLRDEAQPRRAQDRPLAGPLREPDRRGSAGPPLEKLKGLPLRTTPTADRTSVQPTCHGWYPARSASQHPMRGGRRHGNEHVRRIIRGAGAGCRVQTRKKRPRRTASDLPMWSGCRDLNPGPLRPERSALPNCATPRCQPLREGRRNPTRQAGGTVTGL